MRRRPSPSAIGRSPPRSRPESTTTSTTPRPRRDRRAARSLAFAGAAGRRRRGTGGALLARCDEPRPRDVRIRRLSAGLEAVLAADRGRPLRDAGPSRRGLPAAGTGALLSGPPARGVSRVSRVPLSRAGGGAGSLLRSAGRRLLLRERQEGSRAAAHAAAHAAAGRAGDPQEGRRRGGAAAPAERARGGSPPAPHDAAPDRAARRPEGVLGLADALRDRAIAERRPLAGHRSRGRRGGGGRSQRRQRAPHRGAARLLDREVRQPRPGQPVSARLAAQHRQVGGRGSFLCALGRRRRARRLAVSARAAAPRSAAAAARSALMASFVVHSKGAPPTTFPLVKRLTSVGASAESDLRVPDVRGVVAIQFDGSTFTATALEGAALLVNGKKRGQHILSEGDTLELGATQLVFQSADRIPTPAEVTRVGRDPAALAVQRLAEFSAQLAREPALDKALARLLD